jgi:type I restriction enzyme, S subunit
MQQLLTGKKRLPGFGEGKGYQQSSIGLIPEDWEVGYLDQFWSVIDCKHITAKFVGNGFPVASIREVQSRFVNLTYAKQTTEHFFHHLTDGGRKPLAGDLILSRNATVGEIAQVAEWHPPFAMGQDVCLLRKKIIDCSTAFLQSVVSSWIILKQLEDSMVGSTFRRVNVEQIKKLIVPMPPPEEQLLIAQILTDMDTEITALETRRTKTQALKQGMMQELLTGRTRLK